MALETELATYQKKLPELAAEEGKFILIKGDQVIDLFVTYEDAMKAGYKQFQLSPFLVKQIRAMEKIQFISRFMDPCSTATSH